MLHKRLLRCAVVLALALVFGWSSQALADLGRVHSNPMYVAQGSLDLSVALSDGDLLTFRAAGPGGTGMFGLTPSSPPASGGAILTIRGTSFGSPLMSPPSMNRSGALAFTDLDNDGTPAIFSRQPGGILLTIRGENFGSFARASMGFNGTIYGDIRDSIGHASLLALQPGGNTITIVGSDFDARSFGRTRAAGGRTYTFFDAFPVNGVVSSGVLSVGSGGDIITIVGRDRFSSVQGPALCGERVVFSGSEGSSGLTGVFAAMPGGSIITIVGENFLTPEAYSEPAANDAGSVVFARLDAASGAVGRIEYGDLWGGPVRTLVAIGDELLGSTVTGLSFNPDGLNQANEFAYGATLADGRSAILLAGNVPAPGSLVLVGIGGAAALRRRRRPDMPHS